ncbi:MAG: two pore domain potassium channel family protein [Acidobacteria bacterium]|nr:MAG: two pore domain potassium channel family protein [Acidobacteriota bacterium]
MRWPAALLAVALIGTVLWDAFEAIVLPRRVTRRWRLARLFYRATWKVWSTIARRIVSRVRRESFLGVFGPLSLLLLLGLWAASLVLGFGALHWTLGTTPRGPDASPSFGTYLYLSGTTFFTLGLGDVTPHGPLARGLTVLESGVGFGFLALVIGYFPVLYAAFSRREVSITLLDPRAGSPPTVEELLRRHGRDHLHHLERFLYEWERWTAELMESHLSYPVLAYFRSQHANQSWLGALTTILDACALLKAGARDGSAWQAGVTFAMARHAVVDLTRVFHLPARAPSPDRLSASDLARLFQRLAEADRPPADPEVAARRLAELRRTYEPFVNALAGHLLMPLPAWTSGLDNAAEGR